VDEKWLDGQSALFKKRRERREHDKKVIEASRKSIKAVDVELAWEAKNGNWMAPLVTPENGFATRTMEVDIHVYPPATVSMTHKHNEAVLFVLRGTGHVVINDEEIHYAPGDTVFIPHGLWHQIVNSNPTEPTVVLALKNHALMEHLGELNIDYKPDPPTTNEGYTPGKFTDVLPLAKWAAKGSGAG
jgi:mannose-6-phosphate isomerase-like protein (cupin superfamily)